MSFYSENKKQRMFIAYRLSDNESLKLYAATQAIKSQLTDKIKWVPVENYHITLKFLGNLCAKKTEAIKYRLCNLLDGQCQLRVNIKQLVIFPSRRHPGALVAKCNYHCSLHALAGKLEHAMGPISRPETRSFRPHITLARFRRNHSALAHVHDICSIKLNIDHIALVQSIQIPDGAGVRYHNMMKVLLLP